MNPNDLIFIGLKSKVAALNKTDGTIAWEAPLTSGLGGDFVTLHVDGPHVFAYSNGKVVCLDIATGQQLWENGLPGYGYGYASLATTTGSTSPAGVLIRQVQSSNDAPPVSS